MGGQLRGPYGARLTDHNLRNGEAATRHSLCDRRGGGLPAMISLLECIALIERLTGRKADVSSQKERLGDRRYLVTE